MSSMTALAIVVDRKHAAAVAETINDLGGAWVESYRLWQRVEMEYLVMLAHTKERIRRRAPLVYTAKDTDTLRAALLSARAQMRQQYCQWAMFLDEGSAGIGVVRSVILADTEMGGSA